MAWKSGPLDFKNNYFGRGDGRTLADAGNFAFFATGYGILPAAEVDAGAGAYAVATGKANMNNPYLMDNSAANERSAGWASRGCPR
jgi:hypothetical protein